MNGFSENTEQGPWHACLIIYFFYHVCNSGTQVQRDVLTRAFILADEKEHSLIILVTCKYKTEKKKER